MDYIICGLGNPGSKYEMTRHNVGFVALDLLAEKAGLGRLTKTKCKAVYGTANIAGKSVLLMKPQTYMNLSGEAVRDMMQAFSVPPERLIVIFDDADLAPGRIRIRKNGSAGTHNGMRNIVYLLENDNPYKVKGARPKHSGREMKVNAMPTEVDLRGMDSVEAICVMERYLDEAMRSNISPVRIIHGKGTGVLRAAVHQSLKKNKFIKKFRLGMYGEGEDGVTIAEFG